jgi:beta-phosphoglucomutase-like phosphatase (HAD superfamily)
VPEPRCVIFDFAFTLCSQKYFHPLGGEAEEAIDRIIFGENSENWAHPWMEGKITSREIIQHLACHLSVGEQELRNALESGCRNLTWNPAVWRFVCSQKDAGRPVALVTLNMDVFTDIVVPHYRLDETFDVIVNSADEGTLDKLRLWRDAIDRLGGGLELSDCLLIDDSVRNLTRFRQAGGLAILYLDDEHFRGELAQRGYET